MTQVRLPEGDMATPPDAAVAGVGAAKGGYLFAVHVDIVRAREVDLLQRWAQLRVDEIEEGTWVGRLVG